MEMKTTYAFRKTKVAFGSLAIATLAIFALGGSVAHAEGEVAATSTTPSSSETVASTSSSTTPSSSEAVTSTSTSTMPSSSEVKTPTSSSTTPSSSETVTSTSSSTMPSSSEAVTSTSSSTTPSSSETQPSASNSSETSAFTYKTIKATATDFENGQQVRITLINDLVNPVDLHFNVKFLNDKGKIQKVPFSSQRLYKRSNYEDWYIGDFPDGTYTYEATTEENRVVYTATTTFTVKNGKVVDQSQPQPSSQPMTGSSETQPSSSTTSSSSEKGTSTSTSSSEVTPSSTSSSIQSSSSSTTMGTQTGSDKGKDDKGLNNTKGPKVVTPSSTTSTSSSTQPSSSSTTMGTQTGSDKGKDDKGLNNTKGSKVVTPSNNSNNKKESNSSVEKQGKVPSAPVQSATKQTAKSGLPKTGESKAIILSVAGAILVSLVGFLGLQKKEK
ncbi:LPXTG cell wall anchor domain-containing protein [Streptococcus pneumoniae]